MGEVRFWSGYDRLNLNCGIKTLVSLTCGQCHESPPEAVEERPLEDGRVLLGIEHETGEGEDGHTHQDDEETKLLVRLLQGVQQTLQT